MVEELEVDGRVASVEAGRVTKGVEVVELFVGGLAVEELEVDDRVAAVEAGRLTEGVDEKVADSISAYGRYFSFVKFSGRILATVLNSI